MIFQNVMATLFLSSWGRRFATSRFWFIIVCLFGIPGLSTRQRHLASFSASHVDYAFEKLSAEQRQKLTTSLDEKSLATIHEFNGKVAAYSTLMRLALHENVLFKDNFNDSDYIRALRRNRRRTQRDIKMVKQGTYHSTEVFGAHSGLWTLEREGVEVKQFFVGRDAIDGGACSGDSSMVFSKYYPFRQVYAFEPDPVNKADLEANVAANGLKNITIVDKAISLEKDITFTTAGRFARKDTSPTPQGFKIPAISIDAFADLHNLDVGFIKLDIEGGEFEAVRSAAATIRRCAPVLAIAIYHTGVDFYEIKPFIESIRNYKFFIRHINPPHPFFETMLLAVPIKN